MKNKSENINIFETQTNVIFFKKNKKYKIGNSFFGAVVNLYQVVYDFESNIFESAIIDSVANNGLYTVTIPELGIAPSGNVFKIFYKLENINETYYEDGMDAIYRVDRLGIDCSIGQYLTLKDSFGSSDADLIESSLTYFDNIVLEWYLSLNESLLSQPVFNQDIRMKAFENCFLACIFTTKWSEVEFF